MVVDDIFDLPRPVNHDTLQVLNEVLQAMSGEWHRTNGISRFVLDSGLMFRGLHV